MIDPRLSWFAIGATFSAVLFGWPWHSRFSRFSRRMGSNPPPPDCKPQPPSSPPQPLAADLIRYTRWRDEQIRRAVTEPIRFDEGPIARSTSGSGPTTPKPDIIPKPQPLHGRVVDAYGRTVGYIPRPQGHTPTPPPTDP